jgi:alkylation response protein AidB-like acyl-CoA dehydrogenase
VNFDDTPEEAAYREQVRAYIDKHRDELLRSGERRESDLTKARRSQRIMYEGGYVGITWPRDVGGQGGSPMQQAIVDQELSRAGVPGHIGLIGIGMCGPTVIGHGSADQKQRYLKRLLSCEDIWCQLFSEPASGSDLAALRTKAVREGDGWRVNGQKVWTTLAQYADYGILLARTDPTLAKHKGLTMFVVDMKAPGVTSARCVR